MDYNIYRPAAPIEKECEKPEIVSYHLIDDLAKCIEVGD